MRPGDRRKQLVVRGSQDLEIRGVVAAELVDSGEQLEVDLVQSSDEGDVKIRAEVPPGQPVGESPGQPQSEKAAVATAWTVV